VKYWKEDTLLVVNFFAGPGAGKSTASAAVFTHLKNGGHRVELVGEAAKELIYSGAEVQLENEALLQGLQYARLKNLERSGCDVAISDGPLLQQAVYAKHVPYFSELQALGKKLNEEFDNYNVLVLRTKPYMKLGRIQSEESAKLVDIEVANLFPEFDLTITGDSKGQYDACCAVSRKVMKLWAIKNFEAK
jgi:hypothetical protein